jgi:hypothetical protein
MDTEVTCKGVVTTLLGTWAASQALTVPAQAVGGRAGHRCESLLRQCEAKSQETLLAKRVGLWEELRALKAACDLPEADPRVAAKAAFLYLSLPEYSSLESELEILEALEARLQGVEGGEGVLAATMDWRAGTLEGLGREEESLAAFENALQFSQERFGRGSAEEGKALVHLGQHYAKRAEKSGNPSDSQRARDYGDSAVRSLWQAKGPKDPNTLEMMMQFEALLSDLGMSEAEVAKWTERYRQAPEEK